MDTHPLKPHEWSLEVTFGAISTVPGTSAEPPVALLSGEGRNIKITAKPVRGCNVLNGTHFETSLDDGAKIISITRVHESEKTPIEGDWMSFVGRFWPTLKDLQIIFEVEGESVEEGEVIPFQGFVHGHGRSLFSAVGACGALDSVALPKIAGEQDFLESLRLDGQSVLPIIRKNMPSETASDASHFTNPVVGFLSIRWQLIRGYHPSWSPSLTLDILAPSLVGAGSVTDAGLRTTAESNEGKSIPCSTAMAMNTINNPLDIAIAPEDQLEVSIRTHLVRAPHPCMDRSFWRERARISGHRGSGADNAAVVRNAPDGNISDAPGTDGVYRRTHVLENSLLSFANAARSGMDFIELDVHISRDGVPVIHHDWGVKLPRNLTNPGRKHMFAKRTGATPAGGTPGPASGTKTFFVPDDEHCESVPLRIPVTHLTVAQLKSMTPQPAAGEGPADDEYRIAKDADQLARQVQVNPGSNRNKKNKSVGSPECTPMPHLETRSDNGCGGMVHVDSGPISPTGSVDSTLSAVSSSSTPLSLKYTRLNKHKRSLRAISALGVDDFAFHVRSRQENSPRVDLGLVDPNGFATLEEVLSLPEFAPGTTPGTESYPQPNCGINIEVKYPTLAETRLFGLRSVERNAFVHAILDVLFASPSVKGSVVTLPDGTTEVRHSGIPIMFSSFDPDICLLLHRKQSAFPVFFLTEAGTQAEDFADSRWNSLDAAISWASANKFMGIVSHAPPILENPVRYVKQLRDEHDLILATWGKSNNKSAAVKAQVDAGVALITCDHVNYILEALGRLPKRNNNKRNTANATQEDNQSSVVSGVGKSVEGLSTLDPLPEAAGDSINDASEISPPICVTTAS